MPCFSHGQDGRLRLIVDRGYGGNRFCPEIIDLTVLVFPPLVYQSKTRLDEVSCKYFSSTNVGDHGSLWFLQYDGVLISPFVTKRLGISSVLWFGIGRKILDGFVLQHME